MVTRTGPSRASTTTLGTPRRLAVARTPRPSVVPSSVLNVWVKSASSTCTSSYSPSSRVSRGSNASPVIASSFFRFHRPLRCSSQRKPTEPPGRRSAPRLSTSGSFHSACSSSA